MTPAERAAFNAGVSTIANLAARSAAAMRAKEIEKPTRFNFATEALQALADEAKRLLVAPTSQGN